MTQTQPSASAPLIEFRGVTKSFGDNTVYDEMDLTVRRGETLTIIGGSGQGKSVCLKMMIGLLQADAGVVKVDGRVVGDQDADGLRAIRQRVAYVFQGGALFDSMTVLENIGYALREHTQLGDDGILAKARACVDMVGLQERVLHSMPSSLSGGMRKRVALARSIAIEPEVILYDEPTTGLDPIQRRNFRDVLARSSERRCVLFSSHLLTEVSAIAQRYLVLHKGALVATGTLEELRAAAELSSSATTEDIFAALVGAS